VGSGGGYDRSGWEGAVSCQIWWRVGMCLCGGLIHAYHKGRPIDSCLS
jgi:hypothetical protein